MQIFYQRVAVVAYYNEIDPNLVECLLELIDRGLIADGEVDGRSIVEVQPEQIERFGQCHWFAGLGLWSHALRLAQWPDDEPIWTASLPCQPFSIVGQKKGAVDERHLWPSFYRIVCERLPDVIVGEQVASPDAYRWFDAVANDLEEADYAVSASVFPACAVGSPQERYRLYWAAVSAERLANTKSERAGSNKSELRDVHRERDSIDADGPVNGFWRNSDWVLCFDERGTCWRPVEPGYQPLADGDPARVALRNAYGNAIVPQQAQVFIESVMDVLELL